jgi:hypothetical protein
MPYFRRIDAPRRPSASPNVSTFERRHFEIRRFEDAMSRSLAYAQMDAVPTRRRDATASIHQALPDLLPRPAFCRWLETRRLRVHAGAMVERADATVRAMDGGLRAGEHHG